MRNLKYKNHEKHRVRNFEIQSKISNKWPIFGELQNKQIFIKNNCTTWISPASYKMSHISMAPAFACQRGTTKPSSKFHCYFWRFFRIHHRSSSTVLSGVSILPGSGISRWGLLHWSLLRAPLTPTAFVVYQDQAVSAWRVLSPKLINQKLFEVQPGRLKALQWYSMPKEVYNISSSPLCQHVSIRIKQYYLPAVAEKPTSDTLNNINI